MALRPWTGTHVKKQGTNLKPALPKPESVGFSEASLPLPGWAFLNLQGCCPLDKATAYSAWMTPDLGHQTPGD